jgi:hypothetical protein
MIGKYADPRLLTAPLNQLQIGGSKSKENVSLCLTN